MSSTLSHGKNGTKVWESRSALLFGILTLVVTIGVFLMVSVRRNAIEYASGQPVAVPSALCPGDEFTYQVTLEVKEPDTVVQITEDWTNLATQTHPRAFASLPVYHNIKFPIVLTAKATRNVPDKLPPGQWEFGHCNTATSNNGTTVSCYFVPITVSETCPITTSQTQSQ